MKLDQAQEALPQEALPQDSNLLSGVPDALAPEEGQQGPSAVVVPAAVAQSLAPGVVSPVSSSALYVPCAITLDPLRYLQVRP